MQWLLIAALLTPADAAAALQCGDWAAGDRSPRSVRKATRARVRVACEALGGTADACTVLDAVTIRESSGDPCAVHTLGVNEYGIGPLGLSWKWHRGKWDREAPAVVFHVPEVSTVVAMRIYRRAIARHGSTTWRQVNAVFAGRFRWEDYDRALDARFCHRLHSRGIDCDDDPRGQLGEALGYGPTGGQVAFVMRLIGGTA